MSNQDHQQQHLGGKCPVCEGKLASRLEDPTLILYCTKCDWSVATTYTPPELLDQTIYEMKLSALDSQNDSHLRMVASLFTVNLLGARRMIHKGMPLVYKGKAADIMKARDLVKSAGAEYSISNFPY